MQLLVSVRSAAEAREALRGGTDIVDAKDPLAGALGAVPLQTFSRIVEAVDGVCRVTAALGDAADAAKVERDAVAFVRAGASLVKIGFAGLRSRSDVAAHIQAAMTGAGSERVIAVAYADHAQIGAPSPADVLAAAADVRPAGVLLDTAMKSGAGLMRLISEFDLQAWVRSVHQHRLLAALAGQVAADDLPQLRCTRADVVGVRGAACEGGRDGRVTADRVRTIRQRVHGGLLSAPAGAGSLNALDALRIRGRTDSATR